MNWSVIWPPIPSLSLARVADHDEILLPLEDLDDGGGPRVSPLGRDLDDPAHEVIGERAGVPAEARAPGAIFETPGSPPRERSGRRDRGRGRWWRGFRSRPHGSRREAQLFGQGRADQGADPGADVHVPLRLEPIQARPQLLIEADAKDFHASRLAQEPFVAHRSQIGYLCYESEVKRERVVGYSISPDVFMILINFWPGGISHPPWTPSPGGGPPPWPARD